MKASKTKTGLKSVLNNRKPTWQRNRQ